MSTQINSTEKVKHSSFKLKSNNFPVRNRDKSFSIGSVYIEFNMEDDTLKRINVGPLSAINVVELEKTVKDLNGIRTNFQFEGDILTVCYGEHERYEPCMYFPIITSQHFNTEEEWLLFKSALYKME